MSNSRLNKIHLERILSAVQDLEEIGGPDTLEEYVKILEAAKAEISKRIESAFELIAEECESE
jgi:hypothetical protein